MTPTLALLATLVGAEPPRVAILPVVGRSSVAEVFSATEQASQLRAVNMMSLDEYFSADGTDLSARAARCGGDARCLAEALVVFRADLGLVVIVDDQVEPPLLGVLLIESSGRRVVAERYDSFAGPQLARAIARQAGEVLDAADLPQLGRLEVAVTPPDAFVDIPNAKLNLGPKLYLLNPGRYQVRVEAEGHQNTTRPVDIESGDIIQLDVRLKPKPSLWQSPWLWVGVAALAVGVAGAATATVLSEDGSNSACLCTQNETGMICLSCR